MAELSNTIRVVGGYNKDAYTYYPVLIVGAGESGIAMGCRLREELGFDQFRIFDRQSGMGGTWWINRYPGVACDVYASSFAVHHNSLIVLPAQLYSTPFLLPLTIGGPPFIPQDQKSLNIFNTFATNTRLLIRFN